MTNLDKLITHRLVKDFDNYSLDDYNKIAEKCKNETATEFEFYIYNSMFYINDFLALLMQLDDAITLLSNYNYKIKDNIGRGKHLTYNSENYIIRVTSISDRLFQVINAIFHFGTSENDVNERVIIRNQKVIMSTISSKFNKLKSILQDFAAKRNLIVHRRSLKDDQLTLFEKLYHPELTKILFKEKTKGEIQKFKTVRQISFTKYIKETKLEFQKNNEACFEKIIPIFDELLLIHNKIKLELK